MKGTIRSIKLFALFFAVLSTSTAMACTEGAWTGTATGGAIATGDWLTNSFSRVSGVCSLQTNGVGQVHDQTPAAEPKMGGRFMFLPKNLGGTPTEVIVFEAFSDDAGSASVFSISYDGTNFILRSGAESASVAALTTHWNMVAFSFDNTGDANLWISSDRAFDILAEVPHGTISTIGAGTVSSVMLGMPDGPDTFTGTAQFDDYISTRLTQPDSQPGMPALIGDGNNDLLIDSLDFINVVNELFLIDQGLGQPDCNLDGVVDSIDFICITNVLFAPPPTS